MIRDSGAMFILSSLIGQATTGKRSVAPQSIDAKSWERLRSGLKQVPQAYAPRLRQIEQR